MELLVVALFVLLLIIFFAAFFGFDTVAQSFGAAAGTEIVSIPIAQGWQVTLNLTNLRAFLGGGIVFCEFVIIAFSVLDRILDTLRALIRPVAVLVPLMAFLVSAYKMFEPIIRALLPAPLGQGNPAEIATTVNASAFNTNVLLTFGAMVVYLITTYFLGEENRKVKKLEAELTKLRRRR